MQRVSFPRHSSTAAPWSLGIGLVSAAHFANDAVTSMFPALLPSLVTRFRLEPAELALLVSMFAVSTSLPQPLFGVVADRFGRHRLGAIGLLVTAALIAGLSLAPSVPWLWVALLVGGLGSSALHPAGMGLARATAEKNPGLAVALFSSVGMAGGALGPLLAIGVASAWGFEQLAWIALPVALIAVLLGRFSTPTRSVTVHAAPFRIARDVVKGPVAWLSLVALLANLVTLTFISAIPVWLVQEHGLSATSPIIGLTLATFSLAAALGGVAGGAMARWQRPARLIVGSLALAGLSLESVLLTTPGSAGYLAAVAVSGALLGIHGPLLIARAQEFVPGAESAIAGLILGATSGAAGLIYAGLGAVQSAFGITETLAAVSLLLLPAAQVAGSTLRCRSAKLAVPCSVPCAPLDDCCAVMANAG